MPSGDPENAKPKAYVKFTLADPIAEKITYKLGGLMKAYQEICPTSTG
jgi:hypothetical protein